MKQSTWAESGLWSQPLQARTLFPQRMQTEDNFEHPFNQALLKPERRDN